MSDTSFVCIDSWGGKIGRFQWINSSTSGPLKAWGRIRWLRFWDDPTRGTPAPWGAGDPADDIYRDFEAFEQWSGKPEFIHELEIDDRIELYAWACNIHAHGLDVGRGRIQE